MATLRLLAALFLIALGTTGAAFAISGYFDSRLWRPKDRALTTAGGGKAKIEVPQQRARQRFVAPEAAPKPPAPAATMATAVVPVPRPKPPAAKPAVRRQAPPKEQKAQETAVWWPLANLFKN